VGSRQAQTVGANCCGVAKLPCTNNEGKLKLKTKNQKPKLKHKQKKTKSPFSIVNFSKVDPLYKCRSISFYREASGLFKCQEYPCVKRIKTGCARLILGSLQLGLHVIGTPCDVTPQIAAPFPTVIMCVCREKTLNPLETTLSPGVSFLLKCMS
jgi:hypothetical protein